MSCIRCVAFAAASCAPILTQAIELNRAPHAAGGDSPAISGTRDKERRRKSRESRRSKSPTTSHGQDGHRTEMTAVTGDAVRITVNDAPTQNDAFDKLISESIDSEFPNTFFSFKNTLLKSNLSQTLNALSTR